MRIVHRERIYLSACEETVMNVNVVGWTLYFFCPFRLVDERLWVIGARHSIPTGSPVCVTGVWRRNLARIVPMHHIQSGVACGQSAFVMR